MPLKSGCGGQSAIHTAATNRMVYPPPPSRLFEKEQVVAVI